MQGTKEIKRRIKSIKSTKKITKAMELEAASKMKRAVSSTLASRLYAEYSWEILTSVGATLNETPHPFFTLRDGNKTLLILITSDRGLCGGYNSQIIKKVISILKRQKSDATLDFLTIGKKGDAVMRRLSRKIIGSFTGLPVHLKLSDISPISKLVISEFATEKYDRILVAYTDYISGMTQTPSIKQILPVSKKDLADLIQHLGDDREAEAHAKAREVHDKTNPLPDYLIEGDRMKLIGSLAEKLVKMQLYQMLLESSASEQSARMLAMKNASEAAGEMIEDLTLAFNKARQAGITQEISEISAGMASVS